MTSKLLMVSLAAALSFHTSADPIKTSSKARELAQKAIIVDSHIDVPYRVNNQWEDVTKATQGGDFDYPRAKAGGLNAPFMSIYVPASLDRSVESTKLAHRLVDSVEAIVGRAPNKFAIATSVADVEKQFAQGLISLPMGMENGSPIQGDLKNLEDFYHRGIRYITLAHSQSNHISDSSYDLRRQWKGLSPFGKELIAEMNKIGMMIDVSHVSDAAFYQVIALSKAPVIASHSSLRKFTPGFERNMDDDMIKALGENGGVVQINFGSSFVSNGANAWRNRFNDAIKPVEEKHGEDSAEVAAFEKSYKEKSPYPYATLDTVLDHIDHVVKLIGIDHVGIGSDYDGVGDSLPENLKDVSSYPNLVQGLLNRGYSEKDIIKILGGNFLRVWREVEVAANKSKLSHQLMEQIMSHGVITKRSQHSVADTISKLEEIVTEKGFKVIANVNHSGAAQSVGLELNDTALLIFGNPNGGTLLMQSQQSVGLDLPLKALAYKDENGQVFLSYNAPTYLAERHAIGDKDEVIAKMTQALDNFTTAATN
jgi:membrane dipeptidase